MQEKCACGHRHVQSVGKQACSRAAAYPRGLCDAIVKGIHIVKRKCDEQVIVQKNTNKLGGRQFTAHSEGVLFEVELEDMCEQDPTIWEDLANRRWGDFQSYPGETRDSTTGELLDPAKVDEGCN